MTHPYIYHLVNPLAAPACPSPGAVGYFSDFGTLIDTLSVNISLAAELAPYGRNYKTPLEIYLLPSIAPACANFG